MVEERDTSAHGGPLDDPAPLLSPLVTSVEGLEPFRDRLRSWGRERLVEVPTWERRGHLPRDVLADLGRLGAYRERWDGGPTGGLPRAVVLASETSLVSSGLTLAVTLHSEIFIGSLVRFDRRGVHGELREAALDGDVVGCFASTEPTGGSSLAGATCTATPDGDGWRVSGTKRYISNAGTASHALVVARAADRPAGRDLCLVLVAMDAPGVQVTGFFPKLGTDACDAAEVRFDGVRIGADDVLCRPGLGMLGLAQVLWFERIAVAAQLVTAGHVAVRLATAHLRRRQQNGVPLIGMQALRHRLADAAAEVWACEALLDGVVRAAMAGRPIGPMSAALKLRCAAMAGHVVDESVQMLGGRGYTRNYPAERSLRDVRLARMGAGTDEIMRETVAHALDRRDAPFDAWLASLEEADRPVPDL